MGQKPKWHSEQLNQYISDLNRTIRSISNLDNYHATNHFTSDIADTGSFAQNFGGSNSFNASTIQNDTINVQRQLHNFSSSFAETVSGAALTIHAALTAAEHQNVPKINRDENNATIDFWMLLLIVMYCIVVLGGVFGNASLLVTLFTQSSARLRNPLLVALCLADLMVTSIAAPTTVVATVLNARQTIISTIICKVIHFLQVNF